MAQKVTVMLIKLTTLVDEQGQPLEGQPNPLKTAFPLCWSSDPKVEAEVFRIYQKAAAHDRVASDADPSVQVQTVIRSIQTPRELSLLMEAEAEQHADDILGQVETAPAATMPEPEPVKAKGKAKRPAKAKPATDETPAAEDALSILADADAG